MKRERRSKCREIWNARTVLCQFALLYGVQFPLYAVLFFRCGTSLIICTIYDVICCAFVVICSTFVVICCGFATICGTYVIICSDFSFIPTFCHSITSVLSLYRVVYALYGVQMLLSRVHFTLFAVLSSLHQTIVMIYPQCKVRVSDPSSSHIVLCWVQIKLLLLLLLTLPFCFVFRGKVEERMLYGIL